MIAQQSALPTQESARELTERIIAMSSADQTEVLLLGSDTRLTRFAQNQIHQNVSQRDLEIRVRACFGTRVGVATTNDASESALARVVARAAAIATAQPENPLFKGLPNQLTGRPEPTAYVDRTADYTPADRAAAVDAICRRAVAEGLVASGAFQTAANALTVANSLGLFAYHVGTRADLSSVVMGEDTSGFSAGLALDVADLDTEAIGTEAINKALRGFNPISVEPGKWTVILEEYAVADMLAYLAFVGLGATRYQEGSSFMNGKLGQRVTGDRVTIWDDGHDPGGLLQAIDYEGVPKEKVVLIEQGIARNIVHDSFTAARQGAHSTGHALPAPNTWGPFPGNLFMAGGDLPKERLALGVKRGLWITRFHYVNVMDPKATTITGMTRGGTFLIENGEITRPIKNMRFTQGILDAFSRISGLSQETRLLPAWFGGTRCPALRVDEFAFTGTTEFQE